MATVKRTGKSATRPTTAKAGPRGISLPGEKRVKATRQALPVRPRKKSKEDRAATPGAAIDRRRQVLEDEPK